MDKPRHDRKQRAFEGDILRAKIDIDIGVNSIKKGSLYKVTSLSEDNRIARVGSLMDSNSKFTVSIWSDDLSQDHKTTLFEKF